MQYVTLNLWRGDYCEDFGAYYCLEDAAYNYDDFTAND